MKNKANQSLYENIKPKEIESIKANLEKNFEKMLDIMRIDWQNDHNTKETPHRLAKMYVDEIMKGRYHQPPKITTFPNTENVDELYTAGPISIRSLCSHHFAPIIGSCWVGVIPGDNVVGLSKFNRMVDWIMSRPQIQEEGLKQVTDYLEKSLNPKGLIVVMKAQHMCMKWRGVKEEGWMVNSMIRGLFKHNPQAKQEFFELIKGQGYSNG